MNKKLAILCMFLFSLVLLSAFSVSAQTPTVTANDILIGGNNQEATNPEDDDGPRIATTTGTISFTLSGNSGTDVRIQLKKFTSFSTKYKLDTTGLTFDNPTAIQTKLNTEPGLLVLDITDDGDKVDVTQGTTTATLTVEALVPSNLDAVNTNLLRTGFPVATAEFEIFDITTPSTPVPLGTTTAQISIQRENQLEIKDSDIRRSDGSRESLDDRDEVKDVEPGEVLDLEVEVQNRFDGDSNVEIEDVRLRLDCSPNEDLDIDDEDQNLGDLSEDDEDTETLRIEIEDDAQDRNIKCDLTVEGRDRNGAFHGDKITFDIEVTRENHDIRIKTLSVNPQVLDCDTTTFQLFTDVRNIGRSDEDRIRIEVFSKTLGIQEVPVSNLELDEDDESSEVFTLSVDPTTVKAGTYIIQVQSFYDNTKLSDTETVQIENACTEAGGEQEKQNGQPQGATITIESGIVSVDEGRSASIQATITNNQEDSGEFVVSVENIEEFAEPASSKTIFLNARQSSTIFLNLRTKQGSAGTYTGIVRLKNSGGQTIATETFTVDVQETEAEKETGFQGFDLEGSKAFWIIGDIILIIVAIFFLKLIFTGGRKRSGQQRKMADFEAKPVKK